jgi:hypothetical protein
MTGNSPFIMTGTSITTAGAYSGENTSTVTVPCEDVPEWENVFGTWLDMNITILCTARAGYAGGRATAAGQFIRQSAGFGIRLA